MVKDFDNTLYRKRNLVETIFSVVTENLEDMSGELASKKNQVIEIKLKCIAYSVDRFLKNQRILLLD